MRILLRAYEFESAAAGGATLGDIGRALASRGHSVWTNDGHCTIEAVRAWQPDLIVGQQWATEEASRWATALGLPFVMFVDGPGQYEHFMPQCDLVVSPAGLDLDKLSDDLTRVAAAGRRRPTLTLVMTVANEAATLERAVESVAAHADEILIGVDTRSADETAALAERLATHCFRFTETSPPDFPRMRNRALELVRTDWAVVLDGHEWIENAAAIREAIETTAWSIEIQTCYEPGETRIPSVVFPFPRIHRRHVRFTGAPAHEEVTTPMERRDQRLEIKVWHERGPGAAAQARSAEKAAGELESLRRAWQERGDRRALFYFANGLRDAGRPAEAAAAYEEYLAAPLFEEEGWQARLYRGRCLAAIGDRIGARRLFEQTVTSAPERAEGFVELGHAWLAEGDPRAAAAWFRIAAAIPEPRRARLFVETPVYRWGAWHGLALAFHGLGEWDRAAEAEARALAGGAGSWAHENIRMWRARTGAAMEATLP